MNDRGHLMSRRHFHSHSGASILALTAALGALVGSPPRAAAGGPGDRSESPYFIVTSETAGAEPLPLQETRAEIHVAGVIAHVRVTQVYQNRGRAPLEAIYVFPGSTRAAVFGMRMMVGDRTIEAAVSERQAARQTYEDAKESGKTASLLEQERPNVFQMSVANILPGDIVRVELDYTELLVPTDGVYELVYPAVVGPRYAGANASEAWQRNPYLAEGSPEPYRFGLRARISAGMPIQSLTSPSHAVAARYTDPSTAEVALGASGDGNRDFILRYRLRGGRIQTGLLRFEGSGSASDEKFFLLMVQPPARVAYDDIPPREYVFIVDVSGSMFGFPLEVSKRLIGDLLRGMQLVDRFNILFFSGGNFQLSPRSLPASPENVGRALRVLDQIDAGGGTELLPALRTALAMPSAPGTARTFVAITDGYVTVEAEALRLVRQNLGNASFFAFGIGTSVNRHLIEGLARAGLGEPFVVESPHAAPNQARRFRALIEAPLLTDIRLDFRGFEAFDVEPPSLPDLLADRPLIVFGKYRQGQNGTVTVRGRGGRAGFAQTLRAADSSPDPSLVALRYLWARHRIAGLRDVETFGGPSQRDSILQLGLTYHLMTEYTSFVAVDEARRNTTGQLDTVRQPLPLPQGVSRHAVDGSSEGEVIVVTGTRIGATQNLTPSPTYITQAEEIALTDGAHDAGSSIDVRSAAISARTLGRGELDVGYRLQATDVGESGTFTSPTLVRFGLTDRLEARLASSLLSLDDDGASPPDLAAGGKLQLASGSRAAFGLLGDVRLDFDDDTVERRTWRSGLLAELRLLPQLALRANLAALYLDLDGDSRWGLGYAAELAQLVARNWIVFAASSGQFADRSIVDIEAGLTRALGRNWLVGVSASAGLTDEANDAGAALFLRWQL